MAREIQFWDHSKRLDWFLMRAVTRKILARPEIMSEMRACVESRWASDGSKTRSLRLWRKALALSPQEFSRFVLSDSPEAEETRDSFPPYVALSPSERADFAAAARKERVTP